MGCIFSGGCSCDGRVFLCFEGVEDPRTSNATRHDLHEMLMIGLLSTLCGGEGCCDMALFGRTKEPFLRRFMALKQGIPSHDVFSDLFNALDPGAFQTVPASFVPSRINRWPVPEKRISRRSIGNCGICMATNSRCKPQLRGSALGSMSQCLDLNRIPSCISLKRIWKLQRILKLPFLNCRCDRVTWVHIISLLV